MTEAFQGLSPEAEARPSEKFPGVGMETGGRENRQEHVRRDRRA